MAKKTILSTVPLSAGHITMPLKMDNLSPFAKWEDFKNTVVNTCNAAVWSNTRRIVTSKLAGDEVYPPMEQAVEFYKTQNPGFIGGDIEPYGEDRGMNIQKGLEYLVQTGGPDGKHALAFARVDVTKPEAVKMAIAIFGTIWVGLRIYDQTQMEFQSGMDWKHPRQPTQKRPDGHAVVIGGYDTRYRAVTWGQVATLTQEYWSGCYDNNPKHPNVFEAYVVIWPEHIGARRFMQGVSLKQLASEYSMITGKNMDLPVSQYNTLFRYTDPATDDTKLSLQAIRADKSYAITSAPTQVGLVKAKNEILVTESTDLYLIKTTNTSFNMIEVHRARGPDYDRVTKFVSGFSINDYKTGLWTVDNGDLYYIRTDNTSSGNIEIGWATHQSSFSKVESYVTGVAKSDIGFGTYAISGGNLFAILDTTNNDSKFVQLACARGADNYSAESIVRYETAFILNDIKGKGTWYMDSHGNLYLVKISGTASGLVELHVATADSAYQTIDHFSTGFTADGTGSWIL